MKGIPLWTWGLLCIVAAAISGQLLGKPADLSTPAGRGEAIGQGAAQLLFVVVGVILIVMHFVRKRKNGEDR